MAGRRLLKSMMLATATVLMTVLLPEDAYAQQKIGDVLTSVTTNFANFPLLLSGFAYIAGIYFAVSGIFKFKEHVDNPTHNPLSAGVKRFLAGGMFLSGPAMYTALYETLYGSTSGEVLQRSGFQNTSGGTGLDQMVVDFITNIYGPMTTMLVGFTYISAIILLLTGIHRLTKTAQEGPRGPMGLGTIMTFVAAGCLFAFGDMMGTFASTLFGDSTVSTMSRIDQSVISDGGDAQKIQAVIDALMAFIMLVGFIAFIRGFFVLKAFADGSGNATIAQALTFIFGGALAINLGDLVNVLGETVGVHGITFQ